jgi:Transposase DDE domain
VKEIGLILWGYIVGNSTAINTLGYRIELTNQIANELASEEYAGRSEVGRKGVSSRRMDLTNSKLVMLLLNFKSSIQREMDSFFKELSNESFNIRTVTKGAFSKARAKLNPWAFKRLGEIAVNVFYSKAPYYTWHGKRLLGIGGTRLQLPNHHSVTEEFGQYQAGLKADSPCSSAAGSVFYDCLNLVAIDSQLASYQTGERELLPQHLDYVKEGDLLLLDRVYPCFWLLFLLVAKKIDFCVRLKADWWLKANAFLKSPQADGIVTFKLPKMDWDKLKDYPETRNQELRCRLVKVELPTGGTEILCTSLIDQETYLANEFKALYHHRWSEEGGFKLLKSRIELERFTGKTALAVRQDFHAKILLLTLTAVYAHPIEERVRQEFKADEQRKHPQKINRTNAISNMQKISVPLFLKNMATQALTFFDKIVYKTRELLWPNRKNPRNHKIRKHTL